MKVTSNSGSKTDQYSRGKAIEFIRGTYRGKIGWLNGTLGSSKCMHYVIVQTEEGDVYTRVQKTSVVTRTADSAKTDSKPPSSYEDAIIQQVPLIEDHIVKAANLIAQCEPLAMEPFLILFASHLERFMKVQLETGRFVRKIKYDHPPIEELQSIVDEMEVEKDARDEIEKSHRKEKIDATTGGSNSDETLTKKSKLDMGNAVRKLADFVENSRVGRS
jgi:hypothetical protein